MSGARIEPLPDPAPDGYDRLTYPHFRTLLRQRHPLLCAHVLMTDDGPQGLCLGWRNDDATSGQIASLYVAPEYRRAGWGGGLLAAMEGALREKGVDKAWVIYTDSPSVPALEAILRRQGWCAPIPRTILCKAEPAKILAAPWAQRVALSEGFTTFPWRDLSSADRALIAEREGKPGWHPAELSPFKDEDFIYVENSIGLRYHGEPAGWCVTHRVIPGSIRYSTVFVRADLRHKAPHLPMLVESIRIHRDTPILAEAPYGIFIQPADDPVVHRFFVRRLQDHVNSCKATWGSWKLLG